MWALLLDARSWPTWTAIDALEPDRSAGLSDDGRDGVGATRAFRTGDVVTKERITALDPEREFRYEGVEIPFMSDYQATVELQELPGTGTRIHWHGTYSVAVAEMSETFPAYLQGFMQDMANGLAAQAALSAQEVG
ncbi:SRPBCC family protein [Actinosynnema sp. NPDC050436]|uniref:SRPBCC family protein n=1 Tax=Actinosynnema sp. NPDC050436 TaxID=3155659 RepID=UPI0033DD0948